MKTKPRIRSILGCMVFALVALAPPGHAQSWVAADSLSGVRFGHTATLLKDGRVLVTGGGAELYDPATDRWSVTESMNFVRLDGHRATPLADGRVLVTGGDDAGTVELYDPASGIWIPTGRMNSGRRYHTAAVLNDGRVLVAGGVAPNGATADAELYDPATGTWILTGSLSVARQGHTATLLKDGRVLITGGMGPDGNAIPTAELYDPAGGTWAPTAVMSVARFRHTATLLNDGTVLVAGGGGDPSLCADDPYCLVLVPSATAEVYEPARGAWRATAAMSVARLRHTATLLATGKVSVAGGTTDTCNWWVMWDSPLNSAEEYDPASGSWGVRTLMRTGRTEHTATRLNDGRVLVAGGFDLFYFDETEGFPGNCAAQVTGSAEIYDPAGVLPDTALPETSIVAAVDGNGASVQNGAATLSNAITFGFVGTDNVAVLAFECRLDGTTFTPCTNPVTYVGLAVGRHDFAVRAVDTSNNPDGTPALYSWMVSPPDLQSPDTSITSAVSGGAFVPNSGATLSTAITIAFTGTDNVAVAGFECRLDGASFTPCTSPMTYNGLGVGRHDFAVRAVDTASNRDGTPALYTWMVDSPPETVIASAIDRQGNPVSNGGNSRSNSITFSFTGSDNDTVARFECGLDGAQLAPCTSPIVYTIGKRGTHTFRVRAIDSKEFKDPTPAVFTWTRP